MRITGGIARGRPIRVPAGIRPTQDRVRAALFNMLAAGVEGRRVLDLFAGSGALGLEAWSRGAAFVCWVERNARVARVLRANLQALGVDAERGICVEADVFDFLRRANVFGPYDVILADPPYASGGSKDLLEKTLPALRSPSILVPDGLVVWELPGREAIPGIEGWEIVRDRVYGDTRLFLLRPTGETRMD